MTEQSAEEIAREVVIEAYERAYDVVQAALTSDASHSAFDSLRVAWDFFLCAGRDYARSAGLLAPEGAEHATEYGIAWPQYGHAEDRYMLICLSGEDPEFMAEYWRSSGGYLVRRQRGPWLPVDEETK